MDCFDCTIVTIRGLIFSAGFFFPLLVACFLVELEATVMVAVTVVVIDLG